MGSLAVLGLIAAVGAIVGMGASTIAEMDNEDQAKIQLNQNKEYLTTQLENALDNDEKNYLNAKKNANEIVDKNELVTDQGERSTGNSLNLAINELMADQSTRAFSYNQSEMQAGAQKGNELAAISNSGVRAGSSLSQAVELEAATNAAQLDAVKESQKRSDNISLSNIFNNLGDAKFNIWNSRDTADKDRASWEEGGYKWNENQIKREGWKDSYKLEIKKLQDEYDDYMSGSSIAKRWFSGAWNYGSQATSTAYNLSSLFV